MGNLEFYLQIISVIGSLGAIEFFLELWKKQRELVAAVMLLKNEYTFNSIHRGSSQSPFQLEWQSKILSMLEFHQQFPILMQKSCEIFELSKDANSDQLRRRKLDNGVGMVAGSVQGLINEAINDINALLPEIEKRATLYGFIKWNLRVVFNLVE